jgi:hypothetical protein
MSFRSVTLAAAAAVMALSLMIAPVQRAAYAQGSPDPTGSLGTPTFFDVTVNTCSLSMDGGSTFPVVLFNTPTSFDVAAGTAGSDIETLVSNAVVPAGTYDVIQCQVASTVQFAGEIVHMGVTYYSGGPTVGGFPTATTTPPAAPVVLTDPATLTFTQPVSLSVAAGTPRTVRVGITLENAIELYSLLTGPGPADFTYWMLLPDAVSGINVDITVVS